MESKAGGRSRGEGGGVKYGNNEAEGEEKREKEQKG